MEIEIIDDIDSLRLRDSMMKAVKNSLDNIFADEETAAEIQRLEYGKQLIYNTGFIENMATLANTLNQLGEIDAIFLATTPTDKLLDIFRKIIDGIEETFKAKDKELEAVK